MNVWLKISLLLCAYGFFREMRPSEPFVYEFLTGWRNVTEQQVIETIYPMGTYWNFGLLVLVFLVTDMLRYKSVIIVSALSGAALFACLAWTNYIEGLYASQFFYGLFMATEVAYYTYIYAKVDREHYQQVTSNSRSAILFGRFSGSVLAQLFIEYDVMNPAELNYISFGNQIISLCVGVLLPSVPISMYFYNPATRIDGNAASAVALGPLGTSSNSTPLEWANGNGAAVTEINNPRESIKNGSNHRKSVLDSERTTGAIAIENGNGVQRPTATQRAKLRWRTAGKLLWSHFKAGYSQTTVVVFSIWWALATGGFFMVWSYVQPLWHAIDPGRESVYNGFAEALVTLFGALSALLAGLLNPEHIDRWDVWILTVCSAIQGGVLLLAALTTNVFVSYAMYILFGSLYHFMITITSANIAKLLIEDSFALIFGINTLFALFFQVLLTIFVASGQVTTLVIREQFVVYGSYFVVLGAVYGCSGVWKVCRRRWRGKENTSYDFGQ